MYMEKCAIPYAVVANIGDPEKINPKQLRKIIVSLKLEQDNLVPITQNDLLICYCQWIHV